MTLYLWFILVINFVFKSSSQCDHGEVRLVGGSGAHEGRVKVCIVYRWGRVCSDKWDNDDATVVCRQLGYSPHGATTLNGTEFDHGDGPTFLNNVQCYPNINKALLECDSTGLGIACGQVVGVRCMDEQRVRNVTARILNTSSTNAVHTVLVTWDQNLTVNEPTLFKVECRNDQYSTITTVSSLKSSTQLGGLLSFSYNCCVTAVYQLYEAKVICAGINTTSSVIIMNTTNHSYVQSRISECEWLRCSNSATVTIGGALGITIIILISLLSLSVVCLIRHSKKRVISESIPTQQNVSYSLVAVRESQTTISGTSTQVTRSTIQDESGTNHTYDVILRSS